MSARRLLKTAAITVGLIAVLLVGLALAAPLPKGASAFSTAATKHRSALGLTLVTSLSGDSIEAGEAALGSQYALSGGSVLCPRAKKNHGFHETPFAVFGFPGAKLKLIGGKYGFSKTTRSVTSALGSSAKPFKLTVRVAGAIASPTSIEGTVNVKGGPCSSKKPLKFSAKLDKKIPVAPGK
ncbi:MAG TPA: hypothetical protein VND98_07785 [Solirubrobacterales bacterium]|nr:hypothetical protein [Solirubrobacterales bacterium]